MLAYRASKPAAEELRAIRECSLRDADLQIYSSIPDLMLAVQTGSSPRAVPLTVLRSPADAYRNATARRLVDMLLGRLHSDRRVDVTVCELSRGLPMSQAFHGLVLNLSVELAGEVLGVLPDGSQLLDVRLRDGPTRAISLSSLAGRRWHLFGVHAVREHPSVVGLEILCYRRGQGDARTLGAWWARSHRKSVGPEERALISGAYLPFDSLLHWLATGKMLGEYHLLGTAEPVRKAEAMPGHLCAQVFHAIRYLWKTVTNVDRREKETQWNLGVAEIDDDAPRVPKAPRWSEPKRGGSIADPFLMTRGGRQVVFFEEMDFLERRGFIAVATVSTDRRIDIESRQVALSQATHLSFPFVFEHEGDAYMLPEQAATRKLVLYKALEFPTQWSAGRVLLQDVEAADPVLLHHDGAWYLFLSDAAGGNHDNNLQLFVSPSLDGPFLRHPCSPLRLSLYGSRMAGPIFRQGSRLFRPGQNCQNVYGGGVVLFEIEDLSVSSYKETFVREAGPPPGEFDKAFHTYAQDGGLVAFDGARLVSL